MGRLHGRLTYSNVVATLALFLALTRGAAWALKKNSVKSKQIKDNSVASVDVKDNDLTGTDINEPSLSGLSAAPSGPAGGALAGSYPNPTIASGAVGSTEIGDGQVGTADQATVPAARVGRNSTQSIPDNGGFTVINFDSESDAHDFDTANLHDTATNNDRLTAPVSGLYHIHGQVTWSADPDDDEVLQTLNINQDGSSTPIARSSLPGANATASAPAHEVSTVAKLNAGQFVELRAFQDNTDNDSLDFTFNAAFSPVFEMIWLAPAP